MLAPLAWQELVAEALAQEHCTSVAFGRPSLATDAPPEGFDYVRTFLPSTRDSKEARASLAGSVRALAELTGADELRDLAIEFKELPPEDYAASWKKSWKPFRARRLCVLPPDAWGFRGRPRAGDRVLRLEPGGAFGTGRHATTRTCLFVLQERVRGGERVLDAGSGSGILGVTAALLGAKSVLGFDLDATAEPYAKALARDNAVEERCRFVTGGFELARGSFDVVLANIYSDVVQAHARTMREALVPSGWFAFSGCPMQSADATRAAIVAAGLAIEEERVRGRWFTFVGRRA